MGRRVRMVIPRTWARALVLTVALALSAGPVGACSISSPWRSRNATELLFIATFRPDTVLAGPGALKPRLALGHFGRGNRQTIYGQLATLGEVPTRTARALPGGARTVVLVPWDYAADCSLVPWSRSARWLPPGREGLVRAELRAPEHWVDGMPTFDVRYPEYQPFDPSNEERLGSESVAATALPPLRLMHLLDSLPPASRDTLIERLVVQRLHGDSTLRDRYPVTALIVDAVDRLHAERMWGVRPPFAGTLRLEFSFDRGPWRTIWARTDPYPLSTLYSSDTWFEPAESTDPVAARPYSGYTLYLHTATVRDSLPHDCTERHIFSPYGYINVPRHAADAHLRRGRWSVAFEESMIANVFTAEDRAREDSVQRARLERWRENRPTIADRQTPGNDIRVKRSRRGGAATFSGSTTYEGHGRVRVRGAQVDTLTVSCEPPQ